jgi:heme/copper-type cytochrome/quinol oxidase subunit 3
LSVDGAQRGRRGGTVGWLAATVILGVAFLGCQAFEYQRLLSASPAIGLTSDLAASLFFVITGFHGVHVLAGVVYLTALLFGQARSASPSPSLVVVASLFWHFVDFVWAAIFFALYLLPVT